MKKAFFRLMGLVLGLSVFTACYGPAPGGWEYDDPDKEVNEDTKAAAEETAPGEEAPAETPAEPAQ